MTKKSQLSRGMDKIEKSKPGGIPSKKSDNTKPAPPKPQPTHNVYDHIDRM